ncbi:cysteine hydrolase family protein [Zhaonella formicivorans]|uniref:cysteine hydrolase family protein n=1 Tax=Zhaonella formicivorans TaxID=2528593 RepID=UPI0010F11259|nr:isochorismatase family cysteine hydrolase [Zhaonella formicivorans]
MARVLFVVDMLNDFMDPRGALYCGDEARKIIPFIKTKIEEYLQSGDAVIYICDSHDENDKEFAKFPPHAVRGTWGAEIIPELKPDSESGLVHIVEKQRYSGFHNTDLDKILQNICHHKGCTLEGLAVEVVGNCTNICVLYTVEELCNRDIKTIVCRGGVASFDQAAHEFVLGQMQSVLGAKVR